MRYFLIDKVTELVVGEFARGVKNVSLSDDVLHDHFPDHPIFPGALLIEAASQLAGFLLEMTLNKPDTPPRRAMLVQVELAKFYGPAGPGDQIEIVTRLGTQHAEAAQVVMEAAVAGRPIARAGLTFVLKDVASERVHEQRRYLYKLWTRDLKAPVTIL